MDKLGYVDKVRIYDKHANKGEFEIFFDVEPDPSDETVIKGAEIMRKFQPDVIIALGGGSAMDAAKVMWLFYEHPEANFDGIKTKIYGYSKTYVLNSLS